ncbi:MAG: beta-galactosidase [Butyrivibrio sp.]|nr:beta-galactosidase [Butyrivibrio sp.]
MSKENWWINYPWRMVQTNLRETDMDNMDAKAFAKELSDYNATVVTLNAAGILASYNTELSYHKKSKFLTGDSLKNMVDECHSQGIKVIARCDFSKIPETVYKEHPEWAYIKGDGSVSNYNGFVQTCVNSEYQQKYIFEILEELFREHDFDGLFCNMSGAMVVDYDYNLLGPCHCDNCKRLFKESTGLDVPTSDNPRDPAVGKYNVFKGACVAKQKKILYNRVKAIKPGIAVNGVDYNRVECNQDMDRPVNIYQASTNARKLTGIDKDKVADAASTDFLGFRYRHSSISPELMEIRQWQNLANGAGTSLYIMGTLGNHKDRSGIKASKKVFDFYKKNENEYKNLRSAAEVLLVDKMLLARVDEEVSGFIRVLTECHIAFDEMKLGEVTPEILKSKKLVIMADTRFISDEAAAMFDEYVKNGGVLLATGQSGLNKANFMPRNEQALKSLGIGQITEKLTGLKSSIYEIQDSDKEILEFSSDAELGYIVPGEEVFAGEILDDSKTTTFLKLIPEQLYGPPEVCYPKEKSEIPGIYKTVYGNGMAVWVPWLAGSFFYQQGYDNTFEILKDIIINICGAKSLAPSLTPMCEITVMKGDGKLVLHLINTSGSFLNSFYKPVPLYDLELDIDKENLEGYEIYTLNGGEVTVKNGKLVLNKLDTYEAIIIKEKKEN